MASQNDQNHYEAVIADLEAKRDELNRSIAMLRQMSGIPAIPSALPLNADDLPLERSQGSAGDNPFLGMKVHDAAKNILANKRKPMSPADLVEEMEAGGLLLTGNKTNSVGSILNRRQKQVGDIVSPERGKWALKEWYPGRSFGKKQDEKDEINQTETSGPELPGVMPLTFPRATSD